ncbi:MAG: AsnC family transcriptional regulator [Candidatus Syntropharchaeia archaeon]
MDEKDKKILEILIEDARRPFTEIGDKLGVSESTVRKRVKQLEEEGVIKRYTAIVDPAKLGYNTVAIVGLDVEPSRFLEAADAMSRLDEVRWVATSTGDHMIMAEIWTRDGKELGRLISEKIGRIEGVHRICPAIILEMIKG